MRRGIPFVISAPSGTGKTTVCRALVAHDAELRFSISHTTRAARGGEVDGHDYHFVTRGAFRQMVEAGAFLEHAEYSGNLYGTAWSSLEAELDAGRDLLLEIETQGARQVRESGIGAFSVFLLPPSLEELSRRLRERDTDADAEVAKRLAIAEAEFREAPDFDAVVVNRELDATVAAVGSIIEAVRAGQRERVVRERSLDRVRSELPAPLDAWVGPAVG